MAYRAKRRQSIAVLMVAIVALILFRAFLSNDFMVEALRPLAEVGSSLNFEGDLKNDDEQDSAQVAELKQENQDLRRKLSLPPLAVGSKSVSADIIGKNTQSYRRTVRINRGSNDGLKTDLPVLHENQLVGKIQSVTKSTALVILITDPEFRAAAQISSTGAEGIIKMDSSGLVIDKVNRVEQPMTDQQVFTSGLGGIFPPGLYLGQIGTELSSAEDIFAKYSIKRQLQVSKVRFVEVILPEGE